MGVVNAKKRERDTAVDFIRVISMLSVIFLHATSTYIFAPSHYFLGGMSLAFFINQGVRYCVPLFFMLSGMSLEVSFRRSPMGLLSYLGQKK